MKDLERDIKTLLSNREWEKRSQTIMTGVLVFFVALFICQSFLLTWLWCSGSVQLNVNVQQPITDKSSNFLPTTETVCIDTSESRHRIKKVFYQ